MAAYRVISTDLRTGVRVAEIPLGNLSFSSELNGAGELSGTLPLPNDPQLAAVFNDAVDEVRRQLIVERDGVPVWCGIVWAAPYNDEGQYRDVRAAETWSYYRHRTISTRRVRRNADQLNIVRQLMNDAHGETGGNPGVIVGSETSGVLRSYNAEVYERKNLAEEIEAMAQMDNGFDFSIEPSYNANGNIVKRFRLWYPRKGLRNAGAVFEVGRNIISWDWPTDGTRYANRVIVTGGGDGPSTISSVRNNVSQVTPLDDSGPGYPLIEHVVSESQETVRDNLRDLAIKTLRMLSRPVVVPTVVVRGDVDPVFGSYAVGDTVRFICQRGTTPRFPDGLDTRRRLVGWTVDVDDNGSEEITLTLGTED